MSGIPPAKMSPGEVRYTTTSPSASRGRADLPTPEALLPLAALTPAERSALAGRLRLPLAALRAAAEAGLPIPVSEEVRRLFPTPVQSGGWGAASRIAVVALLAPAAALLAGGSALALALGSWVMAAGGLAVGGLAGFGALFVARAGLRERREAREAVALLQDWRREGPAWEALFRARAALPTLDLPAPAEADIRADLDEAEAELLENGERPDLLEVLEALVRARPENSTPNSEAAARLRATLHHVSALRSS